MIEKQSNVTEAARNIAQAEEMDVSPEDIKFMRENIPNLTTKSPLPEPVNVVAPPLSEKEAVLKEDTEKLGYISSVLKNTGSMLADTNIGRGVVSTSLQRRINRHRLKQLKGEILEVDERIDLLHLTDQRKELEIRRGRDNAPWWQMVPSDAVGAVVDTFRGYIDEKEIILGAAAAGATTGASVGLFGGPKGALLGAKVGGGFGLSTGLLLGGFKDSWEESGAMIYGELLDVDVTDEMTELPDEDKKAIAWGAGLIVATLDVVGDVAIAKTIPIFKKFITPRGLREELVKAENAQIKKSLIQLGKVASAAGTEGSTEFIQTYVENIATNINKTYDGKSYNLVDSITQTITDIETLREAGYAATVGAVVGAGVSTVGQTIGGVKTKEKPPEPRGEGPTEFEAVTGPKSERLTEYVGLDSNLPTIIRGQKAVQFEMALNFVAATANNTKVKEVSPETQKEAIKATFEDAGIEYVWADKETVDALSPDGTLWDKIKTFLKPSEIKASENNSAVAIPSHDFITIVQENEKALSVAKYAPDAMTANEFAEQVEKAAKRREAFKQELEQQPQDETQTKQPLDAEQAKSRIESHKLKIDSAKVALFDLNKQKETPEIEKIKKELKSEIIERQGRIDALNTMIKSGTFFDESQDITRETEYLNQTIIPEDVRQSLPIKEVQRFEEANKQARLEIIEQIDIVEDEDSNLTIDLIRQMDKVAKIEEFKSEVEQGTHPQITILENFLNNKILIGSLDGNLSPEQEIRLQKGKPIHAIDPETVPPGLRKQMTENPQAKRRGIFSKKGLPLEEVMVIYNVTSKKKMLDVLVKGETLKQASERVAQKYDQTVDDEIFNSVPYNETQIEKAYSNISKLHMAELKILLREKWPVLKQGFKRIAKKWSVKSIRAEARADVANTRVKDLNINRWKRAEVTSHNKAVQASLNNQMEEAFYQKRASVYASEMLGASHKAVYQVRKANKMLAALFSKRVQTTLKEASPVFQKAFDEIVDLFNFDPSRQKQQSSIGQYKRYVTKMKKEGRGDFEIPDSVMEWLTTQEGADSLTVDQYLYLVNRLWNLYSQAKEYNRIMSRLEADQELDYMEAMENAFEVTLQDDPDFDSSKAVVTPEASVGQIITRVFHDVTGLITNIKFMAERLGPFAMQTIVHRLEGVGTFANMPMGLSYLTKLRKDSKKRFKELIDSTIGQKDWNKMGRTEVTIPEWKDKPQLNRGVLRKSDLFSLLLNMGNEDNKAYYTNYGITPDDILRILERELGVKYFEAVQAVWDDLHSFKDKIEALQSATKGEELDFVEAVPFEAHGKTFNGGYYPIMTKSQNPFSDMVKDGANTWTKKFDGTQENPEYFDYHGVVKSPHTKERVGSGRLLNLEPTTIAVAYENIMYDLAMRIPVRDVMTILTNKSIAASISSVVGTRKHSIIVNTVAELTRSADAKRTQLLSEQNAFVQHLVGNIQMAASVTYIAYRVPSMLIQFASMMVAVNRMGLKGTKHIAASMGKITQSMFTGNFKELVEWTEKISPQIERFRSQFDDDMVLALGEMMTNRRVMTNGVWNSISTMRKATADLAFKGILGSIDYSMKLTVAIAAYNQYMSREAPGTENVDFDSMTDQQLHDAAAAYASDVVGMTLTSTTVLDKAPIQKLIIGALFTRYWNDLRNKLNTNVSQFGKTRRDVKKAVKLTKEGDDLGAAIAFHDGAGKIATATIMSIVGMAFVSKVRSDGKEEEDKDLTDQIDEQLGIKGLAKIGADLFLQDVPVLRDTIFSAETGFGVSIPFTRVLTDIAKAGTSIVGLSQDLAEGADLTEALGKLSKSQLKAIGMTLSVMSGGIPTNAIIEAMKYIEQFEQGDVDVPGAEIVDLILKALGVLSEREEKSDLELLEERLKKLESPKDIRDESARLMDKVLPVQNTSPISDYDIATIGFAESSGKWNAQPFKRDRKGKIEHHTNGRPKVLSSAFGLYQFTRGTWEKVMRQAPELGLKVTDRTSKNPEHQTKAMIWLLNNNARILKNNGISINVDTLYAAHHFGPNVAAKIYARENSNKRIKDVLSSSVLKANPWLEKRYSTVGQLRTYITTALNRGRNKLESFDEDDGILIMVDTGDDS